ncbi:hypothetical protein [Bradyrhizobium algeriense]|uniref:hypothetical protein n=1 Tax=Bradyrhizobium algeriense TaxID=634784 RepID=UPI00167D2FDE|nr:hypothetical protein [Bradyrhizobium algeriense]
MPDLTVDLAAEVSSTNKTDVKSHDPGPSSIAMDQQPCTTVNVPSYRFTDVEIATEGSLSVKLISQGQGPVFVECVVVERPLPTQGGLSRNMVDR